MAIQAKTLSRQERRHPDRYNESKRIEEARQRRLAGLRSRESKNPQQAKAILGTMMAMLAS